jgi:hypothetical protein
VAPGYVLGFQRTSTELPNYMHWQNFIAVYSLA